MRREAWWAIIHRVTKSWILLKQLSMHPCGYKLICKTAHLLEKVSPKTRPLVLVFFWSIIPSKRLYTRANEVTYQQGVDLGEGVQVFWWKYHCTLSVSLKLVSNTKFKMVLLRQNMNILLPSGERRVRPPRESMWYHWVVGLSADQRQGTRSICSWMKVPQMLGCVWKGTWTGSPALENIHVG